MYIRTLFAQEGRESGVSPSGGGVCYKSCNAILCNPLFSWQEIIQEMASPMSSCTFKNLVTLETCFQSILSIRICDCGAQFLVNCFQKIVIATNNSGFNSTYLLVSESEGKAKDEKCRKQELTGKLVKRIQVENLSSV